MAVRELAIHQSVNHRKYCKEHNRVDRKGLLHFALHEVPRSFLQQFTPPPCEGIQRGGPIQPMFSHYRGLCMEATVLRKF